MSWQRCRRTPRCVSVGSSCVYAVEKQRVAPSTGGVSEQQENSEKALAGHFIRYTLLLYVFMALSDLDVVAVEAIYAQ